MTSLRRTATAAEMFGRDLSRRGLALGLLVALPVVFFVVSKTSGGGHAFTAGGLGLSWAIAGASLFSALGARAVDQRLVLDGYRPAELLGARVVLLDVTGLALGALFGAVLAGVSGTPDLLALAAALVLVTLVSVPLGLVLAALVPYELEATLLLIGLIGIEMILPSEGGAVAALPLGGAQALLDRAAAKAHVASVAAAAGRSVAWTVGLTAVAMLIWAWRTRVARPAGVDTPARASQSVSHPAP
jgi:hypothetical protein